MDRKEIVPMYGVNTVDMVHSPSSLANVFLDIESMSDEDCYNILNKNYSVFLSNEINSPHFDRLRRSSRFISVLTQVCIENDLTYEQRVYCNSMLYTELAKTDNVYMQKVYYILGWVVNKDMVNKIMECNIDQVLATYLAISRKSTFNSKDNISRLNFSIMCSNPDTMTVQRITDIYCAIFNTVEDVKELFLLNIRDTYVFTSDEDWITPDILKVARNMDSAVISILDSLPINALEKLLNEYNNMCIIDALDEDDVRFSFKDVDINKFRHIGIVMVKMAEQGLNLL